MNVILISDSEESEDFSLPDIDEVSDFDAAFGQFRTKNSSSPRKEGIILISDDSSHDDSFEVCKKRKHEDIGEISQDTSVSSCCKRTNDQSDDSGENLIRKAGCTGKDCDCRECISIIDPEAFPKNSSLPLYPFVLPYSIQPYANNCDLKDKNIKDLPQLSVELILSCLDEETPLALSLADMSCHYLYAYRPKKSILQNLLKWLQQRKFGFKPRNEDLLQLPYFKIHGLLNELFHCYPENISILWDTVSEKMRTIHIDKTDFVELAVLLDIFVSVLEGEYFGLHDQRECQVYRLIAPNESYSNIKTIIECLSQVVLILVDNDSMLAERILRNLEKLLELGVVVSPRPGRIAKRIAKDLVAVYNSIPFLKFRQRYLSSMQSDLIRFKLLEILLEKYCNATTLSWSYMPESIADIAKSFFQATPMKSNLLDDSIIICLDDLHGVSPSRIEELIMMIYFAIISYIAFLQGSFHHPSNLPESEELTNDEPQCDTSVPPLWCNQLTRLRGLPRYISQLKKHIKSFDVELSKQSEMYLMMLDHLTDLTDGQVTLSAF